MFSSRFINYANCCAEFSSKTVLKRQFYGNKQTKWPAEMDSLPNKYLYSRLLQAKRNRRNFIQSIFYSFQLETSNYGCMFKNNFCSQKYPCRTFSNSQQRQKQKNRTTAIYIIAVVTLVLGGSYAAVPLYRIFCQASGLGGTVQQAAASERIKNMTATKERLITVKFNADKSATMQWSFKPLQNEVKVHPGETALAFYTAKNPTDNAITGISTYNVIPFEAGQYFNKIQCFCFEEQRLNPHEQVDMPVFFYIDPEFSEDPALYKTDTITLSYTFFQAKEAHDLGIQ